MMSNFVLSAFGAITSLLTAALLFAIERYTGFSLYTFSLWFIIPAGAIGAGALAATGYYLGARLTGYRPTGLLLVNMVVISILTFFLIHYLSYMGSSVEGRPVSDLISFPDYLDLTTRSSSYRVYQHGRESAASNELGAWGYLFVAVQVLGFAVGGAAVYCYLASLPYCQKCSRYLSGRANQNRFTSDEAALTTLATTISEQVAANKVPDAVATHAAFGESKPQQKEKVKLKSTLEVKACSGCGCQWAEFTAFVFNGADWASIDGYKFARYVEPNPGSPS